MEVNPDYGDVVVRLRFDVLNVVDIGGEAALEVGDDALLHFLGGKPGVLPQDGHDGDVDIGENVDRHVDDSGDTEDGDEDSHHDECIRPPQSKPYYPHNVIVTGPPE